MFQLAIHPVHAHRAPVPEEEPLPGEEPVPEDDPAPHPNPEIKDPPIVPVKSHAINRTSM